MKIAYKIKDGRATDLHFVTKDYVAGADERIIEGDMLPPITTLHDLNYLKILKIETVSPRPHGGLG